MRRDKFPEKIPFRLTRMLTKAMEVSSIEVNFRQTCENTMKVLRDNRDSLLAIMEAFVYDPLISFRLLNPTMFKKHEKQGDRKDMAVLDKGNQQQPII
jgi:FKBP12-rapamycin complex-associated protein